MLRVAHHVHSVVGLRVGLGRHAGRAAGGWNGPVPTTTVRRLSADYPPTIKISSLDRSTRTSRSTLTKLLRYYHRGDLPLSNAVSNSNRAARVEAADAGKTVFSEFDSPAKIPPMRVFREAAASNAGNRTARGRRGAGEYSTHFRAAYSSSRRFGRRFGVGPRRILRSRCQSSKDALPRRNAPSTAAPPRPIRRRRAASRQSTTRRRLSASRRRSATREPTLSKRIPPWPLLLPLCGPLAAWRASRSAASLQFQRRRPTRPPPSRKTLPPSPTRRGSCAPRPRGPNVRRQFRQVSVHLAIATTSSPQDAEQCGSPRASGLQTAASRAPSATLSGLLFDLASPPRASKTAPSTRRASPAPRWKRNAAEKQRRVSPRLRERRPAAEYWSRDSGMRSDSWRRKERNAMKIRPSSSSARSCARRRRRL
ncbi:hypothetical protein M885DRAFT_187788 [Pelagophyceae sp. CCMP2097]|nr:hypothetical protein M885DRAFT_187788 [Pelagophyceae sp. CCMP2097]